MENTDLILNQALEYINGQDFIKAEEILTNLAKEPNASIEVYKNLGLCEVNLDNPQGALEAFSKAFDIDNKDAVSLFYLANCYNRIGQKEKSIEMFNKVIELRPDYLDAYKSMAMIYIEFAQADNALDVALKALNNSQINPDYSLYYILATAYMLKKDNPKSIEFLSKAFELNNTNLNILSSLAVCYMNIGNFNQAQEILDSALKIDEKNSLILYNLGILNQTTANYKKALGYFQKSYDIEPSITMLATVANCALNAQEYALAVETYKNLVNVYPNNVQYRLSYIEALDKSYDYMQALENVDFLLNMDSKNIELVKKRGSLLRKLGSYQESIETFYSLIKRGKIDVEVYYNLAYDYIEIGDFDNAKEMFKKCITLEPNNPYAHKDLGVLYLKMNCYEWAVDEMLEAIELEDDVAEFHYSLGVSYMMLSDLTNAKSAFQKCLELEPDNADCLAYFAYLEMLNNNFDIAQNYLKKALVSDPNNFLAKIHSAKLYFSQKNYKVAKEFLLDAIQVVSDDETMNMLAMCYMEEQDYKSASGIFFKLSLTYPKNHILLTNLANCEMKCGKIKEATEHLRQALIQFEDYEPALNLLKEINNVG